MKVPFHCRVWGGDLHQHGASFETLASLAPQDEGFCSAAFLLLQQNNKPHAEERCEAARLEARTTEMQGAA